MLIVNGFVVESDKQITNITSGRIEFTDGSSADTNTGEIFNNGPGYIRLRDARETGSARPNETGKETTITKIFSPKPLRIENIAATIDIQVIPNAPEITIVVTGKEKNIQGINFVEEPGGISMWSGTSLERGGTSVGGSVSGSVIITGSISFGSMPLLPDTKVTITMPPHLGMYIAGVVGDVSIGNTEAPLDISASAQGNYQIGLISGGKLKISGESNIAITEVRSLEDLELKISGQGNISIAKGTVPTLIAKISGQGNITYRGEADNGELRVSGQGSIVTGNIKNRPAKKITGIGSITVANW